MGLCFFLSADEAPDSGAPRANRAENGQHPLDQKESSKRRPMTARMSEEPGSPQSFNELKLQAGEFGASRAHPALRQTLVCRPRAAAIKKKSLTFQTPRSSSPLTLSDPTPFPHPTAEEISHGEDDDAMDECEFEITSTEGPVDAETQKFDAIIGALEDLLMSCLLYTSPSPRDQRGSRMPSSA